MVGRNENQETGEQADKIEMIKIAGLIEKEQVGDQEEKQSGTKAIKKANHRQKGHGRHQVDVNSDPITGPRLNKGEGPEFELELKSGKVALDPSIIDHAPGFPDHDCVKPDAKEDQPGRVDRLEQSAQENVATVK